MDCYFCLTHILDIAIKPKHTVLYQDFPSAIGPVLLSEYLREPRPLETWSADDENESGVKCNHEARHGLLTGNQYDVDPSSEPTCSSTKAHLISQADLSVLVHDLNLSKNQSKLLVTILKDQNIL
jgi:hypothetical protein